MHNDDYLWDGSGAPDPEIEKLERSLGRFRHTRSSLPALPLSAMRTARARWLHASPRLWTAAAAMLLLACGLYARRETRATWRLAQGGESRVVKDGSLVGTESDTATTLVIGDVGKIQLGPQTRVRLGQSRASGHRLTLLSGRIDAVTNAPPRLLVVETLAAVATDLGCIYSMDVDSSGAGVLRVTQGLVSVELEGRRAFVPAGASVAMEPKRPPGTPVNDAASVQLRDALRVLDAGAPAARADALRDAMAAATIRDLISLWHLLPTAAAAERGPLFDRMVALRPAPSRVTREGIVRGNERMLRTWGDELGLVDPLWWRVWKFGWALGW